MQVNIAGVSVMIGMPVYNDIPARTMMSVAHTAYQCGRGQLQLSIQFQRSGILTIARDMVLHHFIHSDSDKLFWIDSDMVWEPQQFLQLVALSTVKDVVSAAYPAKVEGKSVFFGNFDQGAKSEEHGLIPHKGIGLGFTIMSREICQKLYDRSPSVHDPISGVTMKEVFRVGIAEDGTRRGEDVAMFRDVIALGYQPYLDPSISLGHIGQKEWRGDILHAFQPQGSQ